MLFLREFRQQSLNFIHKHHSGAFWPVRPREIQLPSKDEGLSDNGHPSARYWTQGILSLRVNSGYGFLCGLLLHFITKCDR